MFFIQKEEIYWEEISWREKQQGQGIGQWTINYTLPPMRSAEN